MASQSSKQFHLFLIALLAFSLTFLFPVSAGAAVPVTGMVSAVPPTPRIMDQSAAAASADLLTLKDFIEAIQTGESSRVVGVYVSHVMALRVVQQPAGNPGYVSATEGVATQFSLAARYDVIGLLAHNFAAGSAFFRIQSGDIITLVYGDGQTADYQVSEIHAYQALSPNSPSSAFKDLDSGQTLSAQDVFNQVYTHGPHLTLQTCIQKGEVDSWGRLFIIAQPVSSAGG